MKNIKTRDSFQSAQDLNEMAKDWPVGSIVKFAVRFNEPPSNERCSKKGGRNDWESWTPEQGVGIQGGSFYMRITESLKLWLVGKIIYTNGIASPTTDYVRIKTKYAARPTAEFQIFEKNEKEIQERINKSYYIEGTEDGIMSNDGKDKTDTKENEYTVRSLNFKLTDLFDEPVFFLVPKGSNNVSEGLSMKMSSLDVLQKELSSEQREVIAEWFGKQLKANVELQYDTFKVTKYTVTAGSDTGNGFKTSFTAGPFLNQEDADKVLEALKKMATSLFPITKLSAGPDSGYNGTINFTLDEMITFARGNGIDVSMKKLLELKRGAVAGKKFGIG